MNNDILLAVLATAIAATLFQPARQGATALADRLLFKRDQASATPSVAVRTLGGFRVERDGVPVPSSKWRSKKARQLFKMLVSRHDRPVHREQLIEALWPDEAEGTLANRLAVAASTVRTILDPEKVFPSHHYLVGDGDTLRLDTSHVWVDVIEFLRLAESGLRGGFADLEKAEALYRGDFLEEDLYEEWAQPLREETRAAYVAVLEQRAEMAHEQSVDEGIAVRLRLLEVDPWNEPAHLGLVAALQASGRHGEARRARERYEARMREIGVSPKPA